MSGESCLYAVPVYAGEEDPVVNVCRGLLQADEEVFTMKRRKDIHGLGRWWTDTGVLFPGYVFLKTKDPSRISGVLHHAPAVRKKLPDRAYVMPVSDEEAALLAALGGDAHVIDISVGYKDETGVVLLWGPLCGLQDKIRKINRHNRVARIEAPLFNGEKRLWVGLRVLSSREEAEETIRNMSSEANVRPAFPEGMQRQYA